MESRLLELEQERFRLAELVNSAGRKLKVLRGERDDIERQRASLLSARSIEHVQRELAHVQKKLENVAGGSMAFDTATISGDYPARASDFLAQLTNGEIGRLMPVNHGRGLCVVNHQGETVSPDSLTAAQRDQIYISLCLALLSAAGQHGVWLPLVLDEPFERLDGRDTAALAAVLDGFSRQGHQVLVFTRQREAAERLAAIGADMHDMIDLRQAASPALPAIASTSPQVPATHQASAKKRNSQNRTAGARRRKKIPASPPDANAADSGQSDAA